MTAVMLADVIVRWTDGALSLTGWGWVIVLAAILVGGR